MKNAIVFTIVEYEQPFIHAPFVKAFHESELKEVTLPIAQLFLNEVEVFIPNEVLPFTHFEIKINSSMLNIYFLMIKQKDNIPNTCFR